MNLCTRFGSPVDEGPSEGPASDKSLKEGEPGIIEPDRDYWVLCATMSWFRGDCISQKAARSGISSGVGASAIRL
jgi:hypothetical protein